MTRKRLQKILMSAGMGRDQANKIIAQRPDGVSFSEFGRSPPVVFPLFFSFLQYRTKRLRQTLISAAPLLLIAGDGDPHD